MQSVDAFPQAYSSSSLVVFSVTLGRWASSFVLTGCVPKVGIELLLAGGNALRVGSDPNAGL